mmetsp:Transcript_59336/g.94209  ORF Transcript_59336/g.94209 Transcript_59336/m.94209 type:complete len:760 (-) Transcript_59336:84-2363(-)
MRPLFRGDGCVVNEGGISTAGNPLSRMLDAATGDQFHAHQMRDGYMAGMRPPMGPMMRPDMMRPMAKPRADGMEGAWQECGPRPMGPRGPMLGDHMAEQFMQHMRPPGHLEQEQGFFTDGPMAMSVGPGMGDDWAMEMSAGPHGPSGLLRRPPGPMAAMRPPGASWAQEFAARPPMEMEAVFQQAQMEAAFREARPPMPSMEAAFAQAQHIGPPDMEQAFQEATMAQMEAAFAEAQKEAQQAMADRADLTQAAQMVQMLRSSGNPKFANSQFVNFIDKVSKGDLQFKDNTVIDREGNEVDWDTLYDTATATATESEKQSLEKLWEDSASSGPQLENVWQASSSDGPQLENVWQDSKPNLESIWADSGKEMEDMWRAAALGEGGPQSLEELEALWKESGLSPEMLENAWRMGNEDGEDALLQQAWGDEGMPNMENIWRTGNKNSEYKFSDENPYDDSPNPLEEAQRLLREGRDREALLALEAEVKRNPESSEGWRQLGQLYAELDQDVEAIQCLRKGHEVDPYNLDSLLALGVSCTNELDQLPALRYLRMWIENHEDHQVLVEGLEPPPDYQFEAWRKQVTHLFNMAAEANPMDADVFVALGVMENINRNYEAATRALAGACRLRPNDHTVWNKLGATLANSGKSAEALTAYHQGLSLKPNYARSWSNLAIAHANLGQHSDAAAFYLSSLVLNPDATHIWNFLHSAVLNMGKADAFAAIDRRDLAACTKMIDGVLDPNALPPRAMELQQPADEILMSINL